jgi:hypothetical protein
VGLGLYLIGQLSEPLSQGDAIDRAARWLAAEAPEALVTKGQDGDGRPMLFVDLHPAAENLELVATGPGVLLASAKTSTAGPGYHAYLVELCERMSAALPLRWQPPDDDAGTGDETGYFVSKDFAALQDEMLAWLRALARDLLEVQGGDLAIGLPMDVSFEHPGFAKTPLGPRDRRWFEAVAEDPRRGIDLLPWWDAGRTASHHRGLALALMWTQVRWRAPHDDGERALLDRVLGALETAFQLEPHAAYPWSAWDELARIAGRAGPVTEWVRRQAAAAPSGPAIGYRRFPVRLQLTGGWSIRLPGSFSESWDDQGTLCAWAEGRTVWFTSFTIRGTPPAPDPEPADDGTLERRDGRLVSRATLKRSQEDGADYWQLQTVSNLEGARAVCTICFDAERDRDWALETWRSLENRAGSD